LFCLHQFLCYNVVPSNVLRLESLARTASDLEAKLNASKKQEKHPRAEAPKVAPSKPRQKEADYRQRRKLWMKNMKEVVSYSVLVDFQSYQ